MRDFYNLENYHYGKSSKKPYNRGKSFGYQVLGFGSGGSVLGYSPTQIGIFAFGNAAPSVNISNLVNTSGVVSTDQTGVGTARAMGMDSGSTFGFENGICCFGQISGGPFTNLTNIVNSAGLVATDTAGVSGATAGYVVGVGYGGNRGGAFFGGRVGDDYSGVTNLISDVGVVSADTAIASGVTARTGPCAVPFGDENSNCLMVYGNTPAAQNVSNIVSTEGVVASDVTGVGTARGSGAASRYGVGLGVAAYGTGVAPAPYYSISNKVNISGVVATDTSGVGTARTGAGGCGYGGDKGIFAYGAPGAYTAVSNLVSNVGTVGTDVTGVGTARTGVSACGIGQ